MAGNTEKPDEPEYPCDIPTPKISGRKQEIYERLY
jgi:hypothetical protein